MLKFKIIIRINDKKETLAHVWPGLTSTQADDVMTNLRVLFASQNLNYFVRKDIEDGEEG